jgi:hypothetical protein
LPFARWLLAALAVAGVCAWGAATGVRAQSAADSVWVQYAPDGPHVRAIVASGPCPALLIGTTATPLAERASPSPAFPDTVCDLALPPHATGAHVDGVTLPPIPHAPSTIAFFGDTGCRLKGDEVQACNDGTAWPFPAIAKDIAAAHPDLVVHVGDYYYRESPCPSTVDCANSPHGDLAASWNADYFAPMAPLFAVAPIVNARGNHEDCVRSPLGWARYLSTTPDVACNRHEPVWFVDFDNLVLGIVDNAVEVTEALLVPPVFVRDEALVDAHAAEAKRETWLIVHRPPVAYEATHEDAPSAANPHINALISGHIHTFGAYTLPGEPAQILVGIGGDTLAPDVETNTLAIFGGITDRRFGYAIFSRKRKGWDIIVHDTNTAIHRRCRLQGRTVTCGPALTGS